MFASRLGLVPKFADGPDESPHRCRWDTRDSHDSERGEGSCDRTGNGAVRAVRNEEKISLNNHRNNNNNRRRGRGNRPQGGGNQANRIDSRARGNAPQLLDKYKKLAQDAQHNGDRVQAEYYLQFADHYFRVIADNRTRQDEQRGKRYDERDQDDDQNGEDEDENRHRQPRGPRSRREDANGRTDAGDRDDNEAREGGDSDFEPSENPFKRTGKPRVEARKPRKPRGESPARDDGEIDVAALPPSIGDAGESEAPKKKRAPRTRKTAEPAKAADDGETVQAVG